VLQVLPEELAEVFEDPVACQLGQQAPVCSDELGDGLLIQAYEVEPEVPAGVVFVESFLGQESEQVSEEFSG